MTGGKPSKAASRLRNAELVSAPVPDGRELPPDCPVKPLGIIQSAIPTGVFLTGAGTIAQVTGQQLGQGNLEGLFAPQIAWAHRTWPRVDRHGSVVGVRAEQARADLLNAAARRGVWDERERLRGAGAWRGDDGSLVLHLGDRVLIGNDMHRWGEHDGYVYPAGAAQLGPASAPQRGGADGPARQLLNVLRTWNWRHADIAPLLLLGWVCAAQIGGALAWRPGVWATGDRGTGKSSLIELIKGVLGPNASIVTNNTTAAGIRQALHNRSLPVLLDELEANDDGSDTVQRVVELLRQSSSGGTGLRGGSEHRGTAFQLRSPMLAASIVVPPLRAQDRSRIAFLELEPLLDGAIAPSLTVPQLHELGQRLRRRLVDAWATLPERLETWRAELAAHARLDARGQDQWGTLLACADLALHDEPPDHDTLADVVGGGVVPLIGDLTSDDVPDWRRCLDHLLTAEAEAYRGGDKLSVDVLVATAAGRKANGDEDQANRALASYGLRVVNEDGAWWLAVANQHHRLTRIFERTIWAARSGAGGGWRQTLLRHRETRVRPASLRFEGLQARVVLVPLSVALND